MSSGKSHCCGSNSDASHGESNVWQTNMGPISLSISNSGGRAGVDSIVMRANKIRKRIIPIYASLWACICELWLAQPWTWARTTQRRLARFWWHIIKAHAQLRWWKMRGLRHWTPYFPDRWKLPAHGQTAEVEREEPYYDGKWMRWANPGKPLGLDKKIKPTIVPARLLGMSTERALEHWRERQEKVTGYKIKD